MFQSKCIVAQQFQPTLRHSQRSERGTRNTGFNAWHVETTPLYQYAKALYLLVRRCSQ